MYEGAPSLAPRPRRGRTSTSAPIPAAGAATCGRDRSRHRACHRPRIREPRTCAEGIQPSAKCRAIHWKCAHRNAATRSLARNSQSYRPTTRRERHGRPADGQTDTPSSSQHGLSPPQSTRSATNAPRISPRPMDAESPDLAGARKRTSARPTYTRGWPQRAKSFRRRLMLNPLQAKQQFAPIEQSHREMELEAVMMLQRERDIALSKLQRKMQLGDTLFRVSPLQLQVARRIATTLQLIFVASCKLQE